MIDYIKGSLEELTPASAVIENQGIGYALSISLNTYTVLSGKKNAKLYVYEAIREDAFQLFGFYDKAERELFLLLISVSGVGASTARVILSSLSTQELANVIASEDANTLKLVKGIGAKTAQRIIIDLKDKIKTATSIESSLGLSSANPASQEAVAALVMLGFTQQASQKAVSKILKDKPTSAVEEIIKLALKIL